MGDSKALAMEILDEVFANSLGIHIIEPQMKLKET